MARLRKSGTWSYVANTENVIKPCLYPSTFYNYWNKPFSQINSIPRMKKWLLGTPDAESDAKIWGQCEQNLTQLTLWITTMAIPSEEKWPFHTIVHDVVTKFPYIAYGNRPIQVTLDRVCKDEVEKSLNKWHQLFSKPLY